MDPTEARALLEEHHDVVQDVVSWFCFKSGLKGDDADSFRSHINLKLVDDNYGVIRSFTGRSSLRTYLKAVVANAYLDLRIKRWGKWRPSAAARRNGRAGKLLDTYLNRDGHPIDEAVRRVAARDDVDVTEAELKRIALEIPRRTRRSFVALADVTPPQAVSRADERVRAEEREKLLSRARAALEKALASVSDREAAIMRLHYEQGMTVASIARSMGLEQRPLYREIPRIREKLRTLIENEGIDRSLLEEALEL